MKISQKIVLKCRNAFADKWPIPALQVSQFLIGILFVLVGNGLPPDVFGQILVFNGFVAAINSVIYGPLVSSVNRRQYDEEMEGLTVYIIRFVVAINFVIFLLSFIDSYWIYVLLYASNIAAISMSSNLYLSKERYVSFAAIRLILPAFKIALIFLFSFSFFEYTRYLIIISPFLLHGNKVSAFSLKGLGAIIKYSKPFFVSSPLAMIDAALDRFLIEKLWDNGVVVNVISIKQLVLGPFIVGGNLLTNALTPVLFSGGNYNLAWFTRRVRVFVVLCSAALIPMIAASLNWMLYQFTKVSSDIIGIGIFLTVGIITVISAILVVVLDANNNFRRALLPKIFSSITFILVVFICRFWELRLELAYLSSSLILTYLLYRAHRSSPGGVG